MRADADVDAVATRSEHKLDVLLWNYHDDDVAAEPAQVKLSIRGFPMGSEIWCRRMADGCETQQCLWSVAEDGKS